MGLLLVYGAERHQHSRRGPWRGCDDSGASHGTFDLGTEINANIMSGMTMFGIDQQPFLQGYGGVSTLSMIARYGILPALPVSATGPGFVNAASLASEPDADAAMSVIAVQHAECAWDSFWWTSSTWTRRHR
jgi:hypothetical protein